MRQTLLLSLLVPALVSAQTPAPLPPSVPVITFEATSFSFGKIDANKQVKHSFKLTNTGKAVLNLKEVRASCGCTSAVTGKWALPPGESTEIEATFNSSNFQGVVRKSITVTSDDPVNPVVNLHFDAEVTPQPPPIVRSVSIQNVERGAVQKSVMRLESGDGSPVNVREILVQDAPYLKGVAHTEGTENFLEIILDGHLVPKGKMGATDVLSVMTTDGKPSIPVKVQWEMKPSITATPAIVAWAGNAGEPFWAVVKLQQVKGRAFKVLGAKASNPWILVELPKPKAASHQDVRIKLSPDAKPGTLNDEHVILTLSDPDQPELSIRVSAVLR